MELIIFEYGKDEINYLKDRDKELGEIIDKVGMIEREVDEDVFGALVKNIVGQQISSLAQRTVCARLLELLGKITPETIQNADVNDIQKCGMSLRKAEYIKAVGEKAREIDFGALVEMSDEELIKTLTSIRGVGVWTAEMILIFSLGRKNVLSFGDLAIKRGMCKLYGYGSIDKKHLRSIVKNIRLMEVLLVCICGKYRNWKKIKHFLFLKKKKQKNFYN